jgi:thiamine-monophosphate kinase
MTGAGDEFDVIARHFAPLATTPEARALVDDAALLPAGGPWVISADAIVEGVHFLPDDPVDSVAQKALRVNISDIAAKGAAPVHYLLTLQWPHTRPSAQIGDFAAGLARDQAAFGCRLIGGDTTATSGPLAVAITLLGRPLGRTPSRAGARSGDDVWVSGVIGDGLLGLRVLTGAITVADAASVITRYRTPQPRVGLAATVAAFANAAMDVSDGLLGDAAKIAAASGVRLRLDTAAIPLSQMACAWLAANEEGLATLLNGGDDYELLFTSEPGNRAQLLAAADDAGVALTRIGNVIDGMGVDADGLPIGGHAHRLGA